MSPAIFKQTLRSNFKLWFIMTLIMCILCAVFIAVFEPSTISSMTDLVEGTPLAHMLKNTSFIGMIAQTFYILHGVILSVIFIIMTAISLIAAQVDRGSMAYLLSTPTKRSVVVRTQAAYLLISLLVMITLVTLVGLVSIQLFQGDVDVNLKDFVMLNVGLYLLMFATSSISFLSSCLFNLSKHSLAFGAGLPLAFFLFKLMSQADERLEGFKYLSLSSLFDTDAIVAGEGYIGAFIVLAIIGIVLYAASIRVFVKKDLPL